MFGQGESFDGGIPSKVIIDVVVLVHTRGDVLLEPVLVDMEDVGLRREYDLILLLLGSDFTSFELFKSFDFNFPSS